ncbi:hypothetical protein [Dactylosporangium sp. NPDC050588]|uniref:hypothetical protein n=1 Tax=Dactylosporangium sp. NPDC050588 TaxID=3157211 RepID=UPI00340C1715
MRVDEEHEYVEYVRAQLLVLPMPMPDPAPSVIDWVGPDGRTMIGTVRHDDLGAQLAVWRGC